MKMTSFFVTLISAALLVGLNACSFQKPQPKPEEFLTLADLSGRTSLKEDSPSVRVINVKSKALIKKKDIRAAKRKAVELASAQAVDLMVQELLSAEVYNEKYLEIERYLSRNVDKYIDAHEVSAEKKIFGGRYYGVSAAFKVNRQKVLVALQKDLKLINTSASTIITVITSKKGLDLSKSGFTFSDIEDALMNQIQTDLNQRGLRAIDFRNAIVSLQTDERTKKAFSKISKEQFMAVVAGSKAGEVALNENIQASEEFYSTGLSLLKQLSKVVVEVNIFAVNGNVRGDVALSLNVTAKNIATGTGGAFANTVVNVARRGGANAIASAVITGLVKDAYEDMTAQFIPQVVKEMSTIDVQGDKLTHYELVMKGFKRARSITRIIESLQDDRFRYNDDIDTSVPGLISYRVRFAGKPSKLSDKLLDAFEDRNIEVEEPIVAPDLNDLVFVNMAQ